VATGGPVPHSPCQRLGKRSRINLLSRAGGGEDGVLRPVRHATQPAKGGDRPGADVAARRTRVARVEDDQEPLHRRAD
jgi:hypothetical protein